MKKILAILVVLGLLGGGGAGAYFYFTQPAEASQPGAADTEKHVKRPAKDTSKHVFVELDVLTLPIIDDSGVSQTVSVVVAIEVASAEAAAKVTAQAPRLKDAYIQKMYGILNTKSALVGGVIQVGAIKAQLNEISHKVLGEDIVEDVLLQVVQQRPV